MIERLLGLPINASAHGAQIDRLILYVHLLMAILFVGWTIFFIYVLLRFRKRKHAKANYYGVQGNATSYLEMAVAAVELLLLFGFSVPFWIWKVGDFPPPTEALEVRVVAQQFAWNIHYPGPDGRFGRTDISLVNEQTNPIGLDRKDPNGKDDIVSINQFRLPVNKPVIVHLSTKDVVHSFAVPLLRVKQDTIPGMSIPIHFTPTKTTDQIREELARTVKLPPKRSLSGFVAMKDYGKDKDGKVILRNGRSISDDTVSKLLENGITEIIIGPATPTEIACAQLCGLGHYRMRGFMTILTAQEFEKWIAEELEWLEQ